LFAGCESGEDAEFSQASARSCQFVFGEVGFSLLRACVSCGSIQISASIQAAFENCGEMEIEI